MRLLKVFILIVLFAGMFFYIRSEEDKIRFQTKQVSKVATESDSIAIDSTSLKIH